MIMFLHCQSTEKYNTEPTLPRRSGCCSDYKHGAEGPVLKVQQVLLLLLRANNAA